MDITHILAYIVVFTTFVSEKCVELVEYLPQSPTFYVRTIAMGAPQPMVVVTPPPSTVIYTHTYTAYTPSFTTANNISSCIANEFDILQQHDEYLHAHHVPAPQEAQPQPDTLTPMLIILGLAILYKYHKRISACLSTGLRLVARAAQATVATPVFGETVASVSSLTDALPFDQDLCANVDGWSTARRLMGLVSPDTLEAEERALQLELLKAYIMSDGISTEETLSKVAEITGGRPLDSCVSCLTLKSQLVSFEWQVAALNKKLDSKAELESEFAALSARLTDAQVQLKCRPAQMREMFSRAVTNIMKQYSRAPPSTQEPQLRLLEVVTRALDGRILQLEEALEVSRVKHSHEKRDLQETENAQGAQLAWMEISSSAGAETEGKLRLAESQATALQADLKREKEERRKDQAVAQTASKDAQADLEKEKEERRKVQEAAQKASKDFEKSEKHTVIRLQKELKAMELKKDREISGLRRELVLKTKAREADAKALGALRSGEQALKDKLDLAEKEKNNALNAVTRRALHGKRQAKKILALSRKHEVQRTSHSASVSTFQTANEKLKEHNVWLQKELEMEKARNETANDHSIKAHSSEKAKLNADVSELHRNLANERSLHEETRQKSQQAVSDLKQSIAELQHDGSALQSSLNQERQKKADVEHRSHCRISELEGQLTEANGQLEQARRDVGRMIEEAGQQGYATGREHGVMDTIYEKEEMERRLQRHIAELDRQIAVAKTAPAGIAICPDCSGIMDASCESEPCFARLLQDVFGGVDDASASTPATGPSLGMSNPSGDGDPGDATLPEGTGPPSADHLDDVAMPDASRDAVAGTQPDSSHLPRCLRCPNTVKAGEELCERCAENPDKHMSGNDGADGDDDDDGDDGPSPDTSRVKASSGPSDPQQEVIGGDSGTPGQRSARAQGKRPVYELSDNPTVPQEGRHSNMFEPSSNIDPALNGSQEGVNGQQQVMNSSDDEELDFEDVYRRCRQCPKEIDDGDLCDDCKLLATLGGEPDESGASPSDPPDEEMDDDADNEDDVSMPDDPDKKTYEQRLKEALARFSHLEKPDDHRDNSDNGPPSGTAREKAANNGSNDSATTPAQPREPSLTMQNEGNESGPSSNTHVDATRPSDSQSLAPKFTHKTKTELDRHQGLKQEQEQEPPPTPAAQGRKVAHPGGRFKRCGECKQRRAQIFNTEKGDLCKECFDKLQPARGKDSDDVSSDKDDEDDSDPWGNQGRHREKIAGVGREKSAKYPSPSRDPGYSYGAPASNQYGGSRNGLLYPSSPLPTPKPGYGTCKQCPRYKFLSASGICSQCQPPPVVIATSTDYGTSGSIMSYEESQRLSYSETAQQPAQQQDPPVPTADDGDVGRGQILQTGECNICHKWKNNLDTGICLDC